MTQAVARPRPRSPRPGISPPPMHVLWLTAGGGTPQYDADRYLGLLRLHGWALERKPLTPILVDVLLRCREHREDPEALAAAMAPVLADELGKHGYRIHDITRCVRPAGDPLLIGRPMTPEEEAQLVIPDQPRPRRRRRAS